MKAMILAAGRGERMRPLTDTTPKPLLKINQHRLIEHHIFNLKSAGITELVINTAWLADQIHQHLGDGSNYGVSIQYSDEGQALETGGGINKAIPLLGDDYFLVVNGDVWCDYNFKTLPELNTNYLAHLVLVNNPEQHPEGDFSIDNNLLSNSNTDKKTYSGIGLFRPELFIGQTEKRFPLAPILREAADNKKISAEFYPGCWYDIGTPERLQKLRDTIN